VAAPPAVVPAAPVVPETPVVPAVPVPAPVVPAALWVPALPVIPAPAPDEPPGFWIFPTQPSSGSAAIKPDSWERGNRNMGPCDWADPIPSIVELATTETNL